jgi:hypothetical protein
MKKLYFLLFTISISAFSFGQQINEFEPNPAGSDPSNSTFELKGTPSAPFDLWILSLENDSGFNGVIDRAGNVTGNFDANGLATVTIPDLENPSFTIILTDNFTGSIGDDLDGADNGTLDTSSLGTILDAVGVSDAVADDLTLYGSILGGTDILYNGQFEPLTAFRDGTTGDWYNTVTINFGEANEAIAVFDISGTQVAAGDFDIDPTTGATFGSANPSRTTASVNDFNKKLFSVYPNPTNTGSVSVVSSNRFNFGSTNIAIYDVLGKQVINKVMTSKKLDVSLLNTGVYIMKITQGKATTTKKLVIN